MALLEVRGLVKFYGRRKVVDGVSFEVNAGEVVGLLGPNGAGKTTSFRMTTGQLEPYDGQVLFNGQDVTALPMFRRARLGMGYLTQEQSVFRRLSVEKNILAILEALPKSRSLGRRLTRLERRERTDKVLDQFHLTHVRNNIAARASGGEKRRLEIARCLVCEPLLILLDEPFAAVDPKTTEDIRQNIRELASQGIGILLTDHNVREVLKITDRSYLISEGKVITHGTPREIINDPIAIREYLGTSFSDNTFGMPGPQAPVPVAAQPPIVVRLDPPAAIPVVAPMPVPVAPKPAPIPLSPAGMLLETERLRGLIEAMRVPEQRRAAMEEIVARGSLSVPVLLESLERREMEIRVASLHLLKMIVPLPIAFEPEAAPDERRRQLAMLRIQLERKAG